MTNVEHYIENALCYLEKNHAKEDCFDSFFTNKRLIEGERKTGVSLRDMWQIAQYVFFDFRVNIENDLLEKVVEAYGYEVEVKNATNN